MSKKLQLQIPTPCHESWDDMSPVEKGRFCSSCQKQVVDFSRMSDREVAMFFKKPSTGSVCGRFMEDQLNRDIEIPKKRIPWVKYFFQFLLPGFLLSCTGRTVGKVKVVGEPKTEQISKSVDHSGMVGMVLSDIRVDTLRVFADTSFVHPEIMMGDIEICKPEITNQDSTCPELRENERTPIGEVENKGTRFDSRFLSGRIINDKEEGIPFATVSIDNNELIADSSGNYSYKLQGIKPNITIKASSAGYFAKEITIEAKEAILKQDIILQADGILKEVVVEAMTTKGIVKRTVTTEYVSHSMGMFIYATKTKKQEAQEMPKPSSSILTVYPNPAKSNSIVHIEWNQTESGYHVLQLFNVSGQLMFTKEMFIDGEAKLLSVDLPSLTTGNYFIKMTNKKTSRSYTSKILVE